MDSLFYYLKHRGDSWHETADRLNNQLLKPLVRRYNHEYAPEFLARLVTEEFTTADTKGVSAIRARIGLLVEYAFVDILHEMIEEDSFGASHVTFNTTNQFADFFVRDADWNIALKIDVKAFEGESAEKSPRFDIPIGQVDRERDFVLIARWGWSEIERSGKRMVIPGIEDSVIVSGYELALERDLRQKLINGSFDADGLPLAASGNADTNFGKLNRIIHASRLGSNDLDPYVKEMYRIVSYEAVSI